MSVQTHLTILRRDDRIKLTDDDITDLNDDVLSYLKRAQDLRESRRRMADDNIRGIQAKINNEEDVKNNIPLFLYLDRFHWINTKDKSVWVNISDRYFCSNFNVFIETFKLAYEGEQSQVLLSKDEAEAIRSACRYILNGVYDTEIEHIIGDYYIRAFEDVLPSYSNRFRNKRERDGLCLFIDKSDGESWKVTDSTYEWGSEDSDESELEGRSNLEAVEAAMNIFLHELAESTDYNGEKLTDVALMLSMS